MFVIVFLSLSIREWVGEGIGSKYILNDISRENVKHVVYFFQGNSAPHLRVPASLTGSLGLELKWGLLWLIWGKPDLAVSSVFLFFFYLISKVLQGVDHAFYEQ